ncbi:MAG: hypothetical protein CSA82_00490 [Actinobacteria bacterium]|nr:MAG: hypothetical protein CSA82_00490 [Actinomycetota bacterium]
MTLKWTRCEGMMIGRGLDPHAVVDELRRRGLLTEIEWFDSTPHLIGMTFAQTEDRAACIKKGGTQPEPGPQLKELTESLAQLFTAEVRISHFSADHYGQGSPAIGTPTAAADKVPEPQRIVEIGSTPATSVPLLAVLENVDMADIELPGQGNMRAILAQIPPERPGWNFGELPLVTLTFSDSQFQTLLVTDDHLEHTVSHNWSMNREFIAGKADRHTLSDEVQNLVGSNSELKQIAQAVPGANVGAFVQAGLTHTDLPSRVTAACTALGLPVSVADFLLGTRPLDEVPEAELHPARGVHKAIGRTVDLLLEDTDSLASPAWASYQAFAADNPWIFRVWASVEASLGATLLTLAVRARKPRSTWMKVGGVAGALMIVDAIAELSLASYARRKGMRRQAGKLP